MKKALEMIGVTDVISEIPLDRFQEKPKPAPKPQTPPVVQPGLSLDGVKTRDDLYSSISNFEGCALKKTAMNLVFSDGNPEAEVMLIGEAPGADEDRQGKPFVGQSGRLLRKIFECADLPIEKIYISNVMPWRPPGNRTPTPVEINQMKPFLERHIELINPKCLILIGGTACKALLNNPPGITRIRGQWQEITLSSGKVLKAMATYHPAYLLRSPSRKREVWQDMLTLQGFLNTSPR